jgi:hypothetical protein
MNTKTFAQESRNLLMDGVAKKLLYWGFDTSGNVLEQPNKLSGGYTFRGEVFDDANVPQLWDSLKQAVQHKGIEVVVEEAAYTWFNRMMALRIMVKNGYEQPQLENVTGMEHTPLILQKARQGHYDFLNKGEQERLKKIIGDYSKDQEAFALLLVGYCHANKTLDKVFGKLDDYTELLLPDNMLQDSGFLHLLNTTDAISDDEYQQVELIGWLYQFYISEKKDEVFASFKKNKKAEAKDIPAATQIFTPNWIVKYMVENTAGKIWLDKHPDSPLKSQMKYLVVNDSDVIASDSEAISSNENDSIIANKEESSGKQSLINNVEELTLIDPAAGSGHILVEGFELLYQMYMEEYYTPEEAVESILKNNLFGLDIDDRAAQLATFAILLKAAKKYRDIWHKDWLPNVYAMPEAQDFSMQEVKDFLGAEGTEYAEELEAALRLMKQAKNLGSVMKLNVSEAARTSIEKRFAALEHTDYRDFNIEAIYQNLKSYIPVLLLLTKKYTSVVANPPYMGQKSMNADLKNYVNANYPITKSDLMTIFMEVIPNLTEDNSRFALINLPSWLFLSSFEKIRKSYIDNFTFDSLLHMGRGVFGIDFGSVAFAIKKTKSENAIGSYFRLHERNFQHILYKDIEKLFLYSNGKEDYKYDFKQYRGEEGITEIPENGTDDGKKLFYPNIPQTNFFKIPGSPIAYWISEGILKSFEEHPNVNSIGSAKQGIATGDNNRFLRFWYEPDLNKFSFAKDQNTKWLPYRKGGSNKKWYGNFELVCNWSQDGYEIRNNIVDGKLKSRPQNLNYIFKIGATWSLTNSGSFSMRYAPENFLFDVNGMTLFPKEESELSTIIGFFNTNVANQFLKIINPTMAFQSGDIEVVPIAETNNFCVAQLSDNCIELSKTDWNSRETSWDFEQSPLLNETKSLEQAVQSWQDQVTQDFFQLHANEEELNRIFIDIYGLQEELSPEVALKDITILQEELNKKDMVALEDDFRANGANAIELPIDKGEVIAQFISYAIGLFMGRYRLDKPGLNIAHPNPTAEELESYSYNNGQVIIDEDTILPLMGKNCNFPDDALQQFQQVLDTIWGHETRTENINFIQDCLDKDLEKFLVKDFYKYHCKMYKKKPIYWLFASPKGAFQVLVYMHRMNAFTVEKIRANYLLEHIKNINSEIMVLEGNASNLNTQEAKRLDTLRVDLRECETYDMELKNVADQQISFDLDDGVTVNYKKFETVVAKIK